MEFLKTLEGYWSHRNTGLSMRLRCECELLVRVRPQREGTKGHSGSLWHPNMKELPLSMRINQKCHWLQHYESCQYLIHVNSSPIIKSSFLFLFFPFLSWTNTHAYTDTQCTPTFSTELNEFRVGRTNGQTLPLDPMGAFHWLSVYACICLWACEGIKASVWPKTDYGPYCRAHSEVNVSVNELNVHCLMAVWGEVLNTLTWCTPETRQLPCNGAKWADNHKVWTWNLDFSKWLWWIA